jgi:hypothetical protein
MRDAPKRTAADDPSAPGKADRTTADALEERVVAFAEDLGRIVGTVQAKTEGWMDRDTLHQQLSTVRDGAADLLEHLAGRRAKTSKKPPAVVRPLRERNKRSGGAVDAPGKKHRKPLPADPKAKTQGSQMTKLRAAKSTMKTNRRRGRG